jgi:DNA-binding CsgD family transcriptional regulator
VLGNLCAFVGGTYGGLTWHDASNGSAGVYFSAGVDPEFTRQYQETYCFLNPLYPASVFIEPGVVASMIDTVPRHEMMQTRFYREWMQPQGIIDGTMINLERTATVSSVVSIIMTDRDGPVDDAARRRLGLVAPHLMRAASIGRLIDRQRTTLASLTDTLGGLESAVFLVGIERKIAFANDAAQKLSNEGRVVTNVGGLLHATDPTAEQALRKAITAAANGEDPVGIRGAAVSLAAAGQARWLAHVLPLTSGLRRQAGDQHTAVAAVFVRETTLHTPSALETLAALYKLTAMEVRVLQGIVDRGGAPEVATALGIAEATVRSHLKNLFVKTGTRRQADLVKLVASAASPFAG